MVTAKCYTIFEDSRILGKYLKWYDDTAIFEIYDEGTWHYFNYNCFTGPPYKTFDYLTKIQALDIAQRYFDSLCAEDDIDKDGLNLKTVEKKAIIRALEIGKTRKLASEILGIGERSVYRKLREHGLMDK